MEPLDDETLAFIERERLNERRAVLSELMRDIQKEAQVSKHSDVILKGSNTASAFVYGARIALSVVKTKLDAAVAESERDPDAMAPLDDLVEWHRSLGIDRPSLCGERGMIHGAGTAGTMGVFCALPSGHEDYHEWAGYSWPRRKD